MESQKPNSEARGVAKVRVESGGRSWRLNFKEAPISWWPFDWQAATKLRYSNSVLWKVSNDQV